MPKYRVAYTVIGTVMTEIETETEEEAQRIISSRDFVLDYETDKWTFSVTNPVISKVKNELPE